MQKLIESINAAWIENYSGDAVTEEGPLITRVKGLGNDRKCMLDNWKAAEKAYNAREREVRDLSARVETAIKDRDASEEKFEKSIEAIRAMRHFMSVELGWEFFRADMNLGENPSKSAENAKKVKEYLQTHPNIWED